VARTLSRVATSIRLAAVRWIAPRSPAASRLTLDPREEKPGALVAHAGICLCGRGAILVYRDL